MVEVPALDSLVLLVLLMQSAAIYICSDKIKMRLEAEELLFPCRKHLLRV